MAKSKLSETHIHMTTRYDHFTVIIDSFEQRIVLIVSSKGRNSLFQGIGILFCFFMSLSPLQCLVRFFWLCWCHPPSKEKVVVRSTRRSPSVTTQHTVNNSGQAYLIKNVSYTTNPDSLTSTRSSHDNKFNF